MAAPKSKPSSQPGLVELSKKRQQLQLELEKLEQEEREIARREADTIKREVQVVLEELSQKIHPLIAQGVWNWRSGEFDQSLEAMGLGTHEPKPITVDDETKNKILEALKSSPVGLGVDDIANKIGVKVGSLRPKMPVLVKDGVLAVSPDPNNGRRNLYNIK